MEYFHSCPVAEKKGTEKSKERAEAQIILNHKAA